MFLAWTPTPEFWALMGLLGTALAKLAMDWMKRREDRRAEEERRESNRKDLILVASIAKEDREKVAKQLEELNTAGKDRLKTMIQSNITTRLYTKKAIDTANNVNAKIAGYGQALVDSKNTPQQVEVINTADNPVPTTTEP